MKDVRDWKKDQESRYYTQLSMLESETANQFIPDANGLNRFKSSSC